MGRPTVYLTDHPICQRVGVAFARGSGANLALVGQDLGGPGVFYGILRGCGDEIHRYRKQNRAFYHIDLGYFRRSDHSRGDFSGFYRVSIDDFQFSRWESVERTPADRWQALKIPLKPWKTAKTAGKSVIIVPPSLEWGRFIGVFPPTWVQEVTDELKRHTDRPILVASKQSAPLRMLIHDAWAVVTFNSNSVIDALIEGVPVFPLAAPAASPLGYDSLALIEHPARDLDRERIFSVLAYQQFTLREFEDGTAWRLLNS